MPPQLSSFYIVYILKIYGNYHHHNNFAFGTYIKVTNKLYPMFAIKEFAEFDYIHFRAVGF
jgi:hypothetical protein